MTRIALIIPTYKEAAGIGNLLDELQKTFADFPAYDWHAVIVDANSPDGTGDVVRERSKKYSWIHLIVEEGKRGIGAAYITGIRYAIDVLHADAFVHFDGDGQHNPTDLPRMAAELDAGFDYILGSRYIPGGQVPAQWRWHRKFISRYGSLYTRILLELPVKDVTAGLKMVRVVGCGEFLSLSVEKLITPHYSYTIQFLQEALAHGAKVKEIPIIFRPREYDSSKMVLWDIVESLRVTSLIRLRTIRQWRLLRVLGIGAVGFVVQSTIFELLGIRLAWVAPSTAVLIGAEVAILVNFFLNEHFSFGDRVLKSASRWVRLAKFHLVASSSVAIQWILIFSVEQTAGNIPWLLRLAYITGVLLGFVCTYSGYYFWVWKKG